MNSQLMQQQLTICESAIEQLIRKKATIPDEIKEDLKANTHMLRNLFYAVDNPQLKYDLGQMLNRHEYCCELIKRYEYKPPRMTVDQRARIEAYADPVIAGYAEFSSNGMKTRNMFYSR